MKIIGRMVLLLGVSFCLLGAAAPVKEDVVVITKEQFMQLQLAFGELTAQLQEATNEKFYWFDQYSKLKQCVRDNAANNEPTVVCIGDNAT